MSDNVAVNGESVLFEPVDFGNDRFDCLDLMVYFAIGCTAWVTWKLLVEFMKFFKFSEPRESSTYSMPNKTVDQKVNINVIGSWWVMFRN